MLYPSVDSLKGKVDSKYTLVTLAAKRARELQEKHDETLHSYRSVKSVGRALEEVAAGVLINVAADESIIYEDEV
ncbi:DNA-directed RNA polymerase subunit omega [Sporosarcina sp. P21c]|uniref:DNA-directed RNA polymerase subunit omega n=1 Tax=Sporosarcina TaxID=1569 RepID=UPI000A147A3B|nr:MULTISPECIES: DNA-directed RNA polymerase subunit omega [Sporosarcina]ARJ39989.1 DNA-directed RNA polymerase subunit omega [Sporosarcina ureae]PIC68818.1 DNA-directed RNA polymerase subunit omega [Sporosarcina sp. P16a]PIC84413.1 DNA-directed RNA polymerase subunit omega [Sporosarcina sp. P1]PIC90064.1 DNA-directed RNA polymerase subunit omega [Sporosarcina sp. P21c]PIC92143.1 DNA-directed RNA polymerase subunit omega [Sporosarcina sp. P25]